MYFRDLADPELAAQFPEYDPARLETELVGARSLVSPMLSSNIGNRSYALRFQFPSSSEADISFLVSRVDHAGAGCCTGVPPTSQSQSCLDTALGRPRVDSSVSLTATNFSDFTGLAINGVDVTNFFDPRNRSASTPVALSSIMSDACREQLTTNTFTLTQSDAVGTAMALAELRVKLRSIPKAPCDASAIGSGVVTSSAPFVRGPVLTYAMAHGNTSARTDSADEQLSYFYTTYWPNQTIPKSALAMVQGYQLVQFVGSESTPEVIPSPKKGYVVARVVERDAASAVHFPQRTCVGSEGYTLNDTASVASRIASFEERRVPRFTNSSPSWLKCTISELTAFEAEHVGPGVAAAPDAGVEVQCLQWPSIDALHAACAALDSCVGYSTSVTLATGKQPIERPVCMHVQPGVGMGAAQKVVAYPRIFYRKPGKNLRTCEFATTVSGTFSLWLQQTHFYDRAAVVRVNGGATVSCGREFLFKNGAPGFNSQCDKYYLCHVGRVLAGSIVSVEVESALTAHGCPNALSVLAHMISVDSTQVAFQPEPPAETVALPLASLPSREVVKLSTLAAHTLRIFVANGLRAALQVRQTGHDCSLFTGRNESCPSHTITMCTDKDNCQRCGGAKGFLNSRAGRSDLCTVSFFCDQPLVLNNSRPFSGFLTITADTHKFLQRSTAPCDTGSISGFGFLGRLFVEPASASTAPLTFPVINPLGGKGAMTFIAVKAPLTSAAPTDTAAEALRIAGGHAAPQFLSRRPMQEHFDDLYAPPLWELLQNGTFSTIVAAKNNRQYCIIDHTGGVEQLCMFLAARGSTHFTIDVEQNDFAAPENIIRYAVISFEGGASAPTTLLSERFRTEFSGQCGGRVGFSNFAGQADRCGAYARCATFYYKDRVKNLTATTDFGVLVRIPAQLNPRSCDVAATIAVTFDAPENTSAVICAADEMACPGERKCLPETQLCDRLNDCQDASDETFCTNWFQLEPNATFAQFHPTYGPSAVVREFRNATTFTDCLQKAVGQKAFIFSFNVDTCLVWFDTVAVRSIFSAPSQYLIFNTTTSTSATTTLVRLPEGPATYRRCTASVHCLGHGVLVQPPSGRALVDGEACVCLCHRGFYGANCESERSLGAIGVVVVVYRTTDPAVISSINRQVLAEALRGTSTASAECFDVSRSPQAEGLTYVRCRVLGGEEADADTLRNQLMLAANWPEVQRTLAGRSQPVFAYLTSHGVINSFASLPPNAIQCVNNSTSAGCTSRVPREAAQQMLAGLSAGTAPFHAIRLQAFAQTAATSVTVTLTGDAATAATRRSQPTTLSCVPVSVTDPATSCVRSNCEFVNNGSLELDFADGVINATYAPPNVWSTAGCTHDMSLSALTNDGNADTRTTAAASEVPDDVSGFLGGGIVLVLAGVLAVLVSAVVLTVIQRRINYKIRNTVSAVEEKDADMTFDLASLRNAKITHLMLIRWRSPVSFGLFSMLGVVGILLCIAGGICFLYYSTHVGVTRNFSLLVEEYADLHCAASPVAFLPRVAWATATDNTECSRVHVIGEASTSIFAQGRCTGSGALYTAHMRLGGSYETCRDSPEISAPAGACVPIRSFIPTSPFSGYVRITCTTEALAQRRISALRNVSSIDRSPIDMFSITPPSRMMSAFHDPSKEAGGVFSYPYAVGGLMQRSTSGAPNRVATAATFEDVQGPSAGPRFVMQTRTSLDAPASPDVQQTTLEANLAHFIRTSTKPPALQAALVELQPSTTDAPVGHLFKGYDAFSEGSIANGEHAHRYYHVRGTPFDAGAYLRPDKGLSEETAFTISMWLRVAKDSTGFAFAVSDSYENILTYRSPLLDRLQSLIRNGRSGGDWFSNDFHVYTSLYVNGPGESLVLAFVDPKATPAADGSVPSPARPSLVEAGEDAVTNAKFRPAADAKAAITADPLVQVEWSARELTGPARNLFNGHWHHVAVVFRVENDQARAQLIVDGVTSYADNAWTKCLPRLPSPVLHLNPSHRVEVNDLQYEKIFNDGVMHVGYFSGALYGLTFSPQEIKSGKIVADGTAEMRRIDNFPRRSYTGVGAALIVGGLVAAAACLWVLREVLSGSRAAALGESTKAAAEYYALLATATRERPWTPPVRMATAMRWCKVEGRDLLAAMQTMTEADPSSADRQLMAVVFRKGQAYVGAEPLEAAREPSTEEWADLLEADAAHVSSHNEAVGGACRCFRRRIDDVAEDLRLCDGYDFLTATEVDLVPTETQNYGERDTEKAGDDGVQEVGELRGGNQGNAFQVGSAPLNFGNAPLPALDLSFAHLANVLAPILMVFQSVYVWATSFSFPTSYLLSFRGLFAFVAVDWAQAFGDVPVLVTPILQLVLGMLGVALIVYFTVGDNYRFALNLMQFVAKRDASEGKEDIAASQETVPEEVLAVLHAADPQPAPALTLHTFSPDDGRRIEQAQALPGMPEQSVSTRGRAYLIRGEGGSVIATSTNDVKGSSPRMEVLEAVSHRCPRHGDLLSSQTQTDLWPYTNAPACCLSVDGVACGQATGVVFSCGAIYNDASGVRRVCTYGLCGKHYPMTVPRRVTSGAFGLYRRFRQNGAGWLACTICLLLLNISYTPFVKTAMMIASCHPFYQCEFKRCWSDPDQKFILAVYLCVTVILCVGIGIPLFQLLLLRNRQKFLRPYLLSPAYGERYGTAAVGGLRTDTVDEGEWERYAATDVSALASMYETTFYGWLYLTPLLTVYKAVEIVPAVFAEPDSLAQFVGIAAVVAFFALCVFFTRPHRSPVVMLGLRLASTHQLLLLGGQGINRVETHEGRGDGGRGLVAITAAYIAVSVALLLMTFVQPLVADWAHRRRASRLASEAAVSSGISDGSAPAKTMFVDPASWRALQSALALEGVSTATPATAASAPKAVNNAPVFAAASRRPGPPTAANDRFTLSPNETGNFSAPDEGEGHGVDYGEHHDDPHHIVADEHLMEEHPFATSQQSSPGRHPDYQK